MNTEHTTSSLVEVSQKEKSHGVRIPPPAPCREHPHNNLENYLLGYIRAVTAKTYLRRLRMLGCLADLDDTDRIKTLICTYQSSESFKELLANAYNYYVAYRGLSWIKPRFTREEKPFFLPTEAEVDALISNCRLRLSVFLQLLKETGADSGEAWQLKWTDVNTVENTVAVTPTKNHNARTLPVSAHLVSRLLQVKRKSEYVFGGKNLEDFRKGYCVMKNCLAYKLQNERLRRVEFRSFRHWKATCEYRKTKDILHVKWLLGHKRLENTLVYTHLVPLEKSSYVCKTAHTLEEAQELIEEGFEYVTELNGFKLFRKPK